MKMVTVADLKQGDLVKIQESSIEKLGTDSKVIVEVTETHVFQGGEKSRTFTEFRNGKDLSLQ